MDNVKFSESISELAPGHDPEAIPGWISFASECVEMGQYVHFEPVAEKSVAEGRWLDVLCAGFHAVKEGFGQEIATAVVNLSCNPCCLYPGEMMQAAICLQHGKDAGEIMKMIVSGDIDCVDLFTPMPKQEAEKQMSFLIAEEKKSVAVRLRSQPKQERKKSAPKKSAGKER